MTRQGRSGRPGSLPDPAHEREHARWTASVTGTMPALEDNDDSDALIQRSDAGLSHADVE